MKLTIDQEADAAYVYLSEASVARTRELDPDRMLDLDEHGDVRGIEFLNVSQGVNPHDLPFQARLSDLFRGHNIREYA